MCGIFCLLHHTGQAGDAMMAIDARLARLNRRGPDGCVRLTNVRLASNVCAKVQGCILHLRGVNAVKQPLQATPSSIDDDLQSSFFLWNGEVFDGVQVAVDANDTEVMFRALEESSCGDGHDLHSSAVLSLMSRVHGPWAFVYWQASSKRLWFGRDMFGRRSLLWTRSNSDNVFALSSVVDRPIMMTANDSSMRDTRVWEEVPACGIFCMDLSRLVVGTSIKTYLELVRCYTWNGAGKSPDASNSLLAPVAESVCESICSQDLRTIYDGIHEMMATSRPSASAIFAELLKWDNPFRAQVCQLEALLSDAVKRRVENHKAIGLCCKTCTRDETSKHCVHAKIAILFSGGLDSTVLCALATRFVPLDEPIDLLNVAFAMGKASSQCIYDVPDRISGRKALEELRKIGPKRQWNFVEINVSKEEMDIEKKVNFHFFICKMTKINLNFDSSFIKNVNLCQNSETQIADVVYPLTTVLDNDLGSAVWFAARGKGRLFANGSYVDYTSPAKVVLTGIGADEQLGGYSRHRVCYERGGWPALISEIRMEMGRISQRNLGRDDRVIADHGREGRFPFLDEHLVNYLNALPIWLKVNLDLRRGIGDKVLLRTLAFNLGLEFTSSLEKRALQFGSRIAKMEKSRNGYDTCSRLLAKIK